jgi:hypothetical protein
MNDRESDLLKRLLSRPLVPSSADDTLASVFQGTSPPRIGSWGKRGFGFVTSWTAGMRLEPWLSTGNGWSLRGGDYGPRRRIASGPRRAAKVPATLIAYPILDGLSYGLNEYFQRGVHDLDEAAGTHITILYVGDTAQCGKNHAGQRSRELRESDARDAAKWVKDIHLTGRETNYRLGQMMELQQKLGLSSSDLPCIAFRVRRGSGLIGLLRIPAFWYELAGSLRTFDRCFRAWLGREDVRHLATAGLSESDLVAPLGASLAALTAEIEEAIAVPGAMGESPRKPEANAFQRDGEHWRIHFCGRVLPPIDDLKGLRVIQFLLGHPGREYTGLALTRGLLDKPLPDPRSSTGTGATDARWDSDGMQVLDDMEERQKVGTPAAHRKLRKRRAELIERKEEIETLGGDVPIELLEEVEELERTAMADYDRKGRPRWEGGDRRKAQSRINQLLVLARERIEALSPELAIHLRNSIQTGGAVYSYRPDRTIDWTL